MGPVEAAGINDQPIVLVQILGGLGYFPIPSKPVAIKLTLLVDE